MIRQEQRVQFKGKIIWGKNFNQTKKMTLWQVVLKSSEIGWIEALKMDGLAKTKETSKNSFPLEDKFVEFRQNSFFHPKIVTFFTKKQENSAFF